MAHPNGFVVNEVNVIAIVAHCANRVYAKQKGAYAPPVLCTNTAC